MPNAVAAPTAGRGEIRDFGYRQQSAPPQPIHLIRHSLGHGSLGGKSTILGLQINDLRVGADRWQEKGAHALASADRIVSARGYEDWFCTALELTTKLGLTACRTGDFSGTEWRAAPPRQTHPFLTGISGAYGAEGLNQLYLHWQYERWE